MQLVTTNMATQTLFLTALLLAATVPVAISDDASRIPPNKAQLSGWFSANVKSATERKAELDPKLAAAEEGPAKIIKVSKDGKGDFKTVNDAIISVSSGNAKRVVIVLGPGVYTEKVTIERTKHFISLYGDPKNPPTIEFAGTALQYGTVNSATLIVESDYFTAANIIIKNSSPKPDGVRKGAQAVALRISGDKAAFYNCQILGFQDTLCDDKGKHFFKDCLITGTVDFIFGSGKSLYLNSEIRVLEETGLTVITAQAGESESEDTGYSFVHCSVTGSGKGTYLGRAWKARPRVVFAFSSLGGVVNPLGWSDNFQPSRDKTVFFGEHRCTGAQANLETRVKFTKELSEADVQPFITLAYIQGSKWLLPPPKVKTA